MIKYLVTLASTGKIRGSIISWDEEWHEELSGHLIQRVNFQYKGKRTQAPDIVITKGKAGRSHREQALLQFNSEVKQKLDKGYKEVGTDPDLIPEEDIRALLGDTKTDQSGFSKHMLAKQSDKVPESTINKLPYWYISRKLDGVRCGIYWDGQNARTASRGGGNYDCSMVQILEHPKLVEFFKAHPDWTLDGEIYKHGWSLMKLSGEARRCETAMGSDSLEFWIYDVMVPNVPFEERLSILAKIGAELELGYNPYKEWEEGDLRIQMLPQDSVTGLENIDKLHDLYVSEGFEGAVFRDPSKEYGFGKRDNRMLKRKKFTDAEFEIVGLSEGLREEDMCFILKTEDGKEFNAKPMGSRELKQQYRDDLQDIIGKMATVKYFYYSEDGIPQLPVLKCIRDYD